MCQRTALMCCVPGGIGQAQFVSGHMGALGKKLVRMGIFCATSKATPCAYNPDGGMRVQLAWRRHWVSKRHSDGGAVRSRRRGPVVFQ